MPGRRIALAWFGLSLFALTQVATGVLRGRVTETSGTAVPGASVVITGPNAHNSPAEGAAQSRTVTSDSAGNYEASGLAPGTYRVIASAPGFEPKTETVTVAASGTATWNAALTPSLSLSSLGFPASATQSDAAEQARLDRRAHMLKIHQTLGVITTVPLAATVATGFFAGGRETSSTMRNIHAGLGISTATLYGLTAYYAIRAPRILGEKEHGPIRLHEIMAWIHGPGMVLTPILGDMAYQQRSRGERVHGIAKLHGEVAIATVAAYTVAILAVTKHSGPPKPVRSGFNWLLGRHPAVTAASSAGQP